MGFGVGGKTTKGLCYAPCWVSDGPECSIGVSFVIERGFNPVGKDHKGAWHCLGSIWAMFGLFWPTFGTMGTMGGSGFKSSWFPCLL